MANSNIACTCSRLPNGTGGSLPAAWLAMHDRVTLVSVNGECFQARPGTLASGDPEQLTLVFTSDEGLTSTVPISCLQAVTSVVAPDHAEVIASVARSLGSPFEIPNGSVHWHAIADLHHYVEVVVTLRPHECLTLRP
jgi:hypothetical protein